MSSSKQGSRLLPLSADAITSFPARAFFRCFWRIGPPRSLSVSSSESASICSPGRSAGAARGGPGIDANLEIPTSLLGPFYCPRPIFWRAYYRSVTTHSLAGLYGSRLLHLHHLYSCFEVLGDLCCSSPAFDTFSAQLTSSETARAVAIGGRPSTRSAR